MNLTSRLRRLTEGTPSMEVLRTVARPFETGWRRRGRRDEENLRLIVAMTLDVDSNGIDVGANRGDVLDFLLEAAPKGHHLAFEPIPTLAAALRARYPSARIIEAACASKPGRAEFTHVVSRNSISGLRARPEIVGEQTESITVEVVRVDDLVDRSFPPALLKIDVEGAEVEVMRGALTTICDFQPMVLFEHGRAASALYGTEATEIETMLRGEAGLRLFDLEGRSLAGDRFAQVVAEGSRWNFVARR